MKRTTFIPLAALACLVAGCADTGAPAGALTQSELEALTADGLSMAIGTPGSGFSGQFELTAEGTGAGYFDNAEGERTRLRGPWEIRNGQFCRVWDVVDASGNRISEGEDVCEDWVRIDDTSVAVLVDGRQIGVNDW
ncbi:hypothetical protein ACVDG3_21295 [Meridianimarinicoccus sp. RP-17]|uniref:hypothetical protein n=1 Tax=Meridianimarinicoccus zhengii TaxID=2056810 RepID=UPI000DABDC9A|nr:hypothetical protein [Phycocomes zhengii]